MKRGTVQIFHISASGQQLGLCCLAAAFTLGLLLGLRTVIKANLESGQLEEYLQAFFVHAQTAAVAQPAPWSALWRIARWSCFVVLMGFTGLGVLGIPALFTVRGCLLGIAVGTFAALYGGVGVVLAFVAVGLTALIELPVLFVLGVQGFSAACGQGSYALGRRKSAPAVGKTEWLLLGLCGVMLICCVLLEYTVVPTLLRGISQWILK